MAPFGEGQALERMGQGLAAFRPDRPGAPCGREGGAQVHHGVGGGDPPGLGGRVQDGDLVVILEGTGKGRKAPVAIGAVDGTDPLHPEGAAFGGAQGAHAGGAQHGDALGKRPEDLPMPDRRSLPEQPVHQPDRTGAQGARRAVKVALPRRGQQDGLRRDGSRGLARQAGAEEDDGRVHACARVRARARAPGA